MSHVLFVREFFEKSLLLGKKIAVSDTLFAFTNVPRNSSECLTRDVNNYIRVFWDAQLPALVLLILRQNKSEVLLTRNNANIWKSTS